MFDGLNAEAPAGSAHGQRCEVVPRRFPAVVAGTARAASEAQAIRICFGPPPGRCSILLLRTTIVIVEEAQKALDELVMRALNGALAPQLNGGSMPDFFETLKHGLGKGVSTVSIKSKEMRDTSRVKSQIADLERQKKDAIAALGMSVCGMLDSGPIDETALRAARAA